MSQDEQAKGTPYDPNFMFPVRDMENDRVKLALFDVRPNFVLSLIMVSKAHTAFFHN